LRLRAKGLCAFPLTSLFVPMWGVWLLINTNYLNYHSWICISSWLCWHNPSIFFIGESSAWKYFISIARSEDSEILVNWIWNWIVSLEWIRNNSCS
jgi:hypothetical protein